MNHFRTDMSHKIVVIEDNPEVSENISAILKLGTYEVFTANNGKQGIELIQQNKPDLILCDIVMPDLDGYGVLHLLSKDPETANIPFIYLTAKADKSDFRTGMNLGADDYITKPFDGFELLKVIELRLKKNGMAKTTFHDNGDANSFFNIAKQLPEFQRLSTNRVPRLYKKKEYIFIEGQHPNYLYLIADGLVKTFKSNNDGKELITGLHGKNEFLGFVSLLENKPNNESAIVMKDAEVYLIPQQEFLKMIYNNKEIAKKFITMLSHGLYEAENMMFELAYQSVRQRVANVLVKLCSHKDPTAKNPDTILVARKDLSKIVGTSTESLNRTLADFKDEGLIEILDKGLKVLEYTKLDKIRR